MLFTLTSIIIHRLNLERRINLLIYLNKDWKEEYGGHFELWNKRNDQPLNKSSCRSSIVAQFLPPTTSVSYHGHPNPAFLPFLTGPASLWQPTTIRTVALKKNSARSTLHCLFIAQGRQEETPALFRKIMRAFCPPIVTNAYRKITRLSSSDNWLGQVRIPMTQNKRRNGSSVSVRKINHFRGKA